MTETRPSRMTSDDFITWTKARPEGGKHELSSGEIVSMGPERALHNEMVVRFCQRILNAIDAARLPCQVYANSMAVEVDPDTIYHPDVVVRSGPRMLPDTLKMIDPMIIIEILSPESQNRDSVEKLAAYSRIPSLRHYLLVNPTRRMIIHHERTRAGAVTTNILVDQAIRLDPPGIEIAGVFPEE